MDLQLWIASAGTENVARKLKVDISTVRHWRRGHCLPKPEYMFLIVRLSEGRVTYESMIENYFKSKKLETPA